jgi:dienelactone hydrolase
MIFKPASRSCAIFPACPEKSARWAIAWAAGSLISLRRAPMRGYYGVYIQDQLAEASAIAHPLMLHIAAADEFVPPPAQEKIVAGLSSNSHVTLHSYAGMAHAFARVGGAHYDKANADLANNRTINFFRQQLD